MKRTGDIRYIRDARMKRKNDQLTKRDLFKMASGGLFVIGVLLAGGTGMVSVAGGVMFIASLPGVIMSVNERR